MKIPFQKRQIMAFADDRADVVRKLFDPTRYLVPGLVLSWHMNLIICHLIGLTRCNAENIPWKIQTIGMNNQSISETHVNVP